MSRLTHGLRGHNLYHRWRNMITRCTNPNDKFYDNYGGRGIKVCDEWKKDFKCFFEWSLLNGWHIDLTLDRIDNEGNYEPCNCRWVSLTVQARNKSNSIYITYKGETKNIHEWVKITGIKYNTLHRRLFAYKWPLDTIFKPINNKYHKN